MQGASHAKNNSTLKLPTEQNTLNLSTLLLVGLRCIIVASLFKGLEPDLMAIEWGQLLLLGGGHLILENFLKNEQSVIQMRKQELARKRPF